MSLNLSVPYIRLATVDDLDELATMTQRAFILNPAQTYLANLRSPLTAAAKDSRARDDQTDFMKYLMRRAWHLHGRITIVVLPSATSGGKDRIIACTVWRSRVAGAVRKSPSRLNDLRLGLLGLLSSWGLGLPARITDLSEPTERAFRDEWTQRGLPGTPDDSWHLQLAGVDPEFQGKGYFSMLLFEALQHAPRRAIFMLEATTPHARDIYKHLGFQVVKEVVIAQGKVDLRGVSATGETAVGFPVYAMLKA